MKDLDNKPMTQGKIEVDENSNEPVFVDVPVEQVPINSEVVTEESSQITPLDALLASRALAWSSTRCMPQPLVGSLSR